MTGARKRACSVCGAPIPATTTRCPRHALPPRDRSAATKRLHAELKAAATRCALCGEPPRLDDPWVIDHRIPRSRGGSDSIENLQVAHRSCNARKGADTTNRGAGTRRATETGVSTPADFREKKSADRDSRLTAIHEAAHLAVGWLLGASIDGASTIVGGRGYFGLASVTAARPSDRAAETVSAFGLVGEDPELRFALEAGALMDLAGYAAERRLRFLERQALYDAELDAVRRWRLDDDEPIAPARPQLNTGEQLKPSSTPKPEVPEHEARELADYVVRSHDVERAAERLGLLVADDRKATAAYVLLLEREAARLVAQPRVWAAIEAVAGELEQHRTLPSARIVDVLQVHLPKEAPMAREPKTMRCIAEFVHDPLGVDVRIPIGERRPADDPAVREVPGAWVESKVGPTPPSDLVTCVCSFVNAAGRAIVGHQYRQGDPLVESVPENFVPGFLTQDEARSLLACRIYNSPAKRAERAESRRRAAEQEESRRQQRLDEAAQLEAKAAALRAGS